MEIMPINIDSQPALNAFGKLFQFFKGKIMSLEQVDEEKKQQTLSMFEKLFKKVNEKKASVEETVESYGILATRIISESFAMRGILATIKLGQTAQERADELLREATNAGMGLWNNAKEAALASGQEMDPNHLHGARILGGIVGQTVAGATVLGMTTTAIVGTVVTPVTLAVLSATLCPYSTGVLVAAGGIAAAGLLTTQVVAVAAEALYDLDIPDNSIVDKIGKFGDRIFEIMEETIKKVEAFIESGEKKGEQLAEDMYKIGVALKAGSKQLASESIKILKASYQQVKESDKVIIKAKLEKGLENLVPKNLKSTIKQVVKKVMSKIPAKQKSANAR